MVHFKIHSLILYLLSGEFNLSMYKVIIDMWGFIQHIVNSVLLVLYIFDFFFLIICCSSLVDFYSGTIWILSLLPLCEWFTSWALHIHIFMMVDVVLSHPGLGLLSTSCRAALVVTNSLIICLSEKGHFSFIHEGSFCWR